MAARSAEVEACHVETLPSMVEKIKLFVTGKIDGRYGTTISSLHDGQKVHDIGQKTRVENIGTRE